MKLLGALLGLSIVAIAAPPLPELAIGDELPQLRGEFLSGRTAVLPQASSGRVTLLVLGFTYDSRFGVEAWVKRFREEFDAETRVTFFEMPMIGGMARMAKWFIDSGMRRGTPKADHEHVITVYGGTDQWKQRVGFRDPKAPYLLLLNPGGKLVWRHAGNINDEAYKALSAQVTTLLSAN
jgi:hypothetical protein